MMKLFSAENLLLAFLAVFSLLLAALHFFAPAMVLMAVAAVVLGVYVFSDIRLLLWYRGLKAGQKQ